MISLQRVGKNYGMAAGAVPVLRQVSLEIARGEFVAITGPSGSGKSTLLNIIGCLERLDEGTYHLTGKAIAGMSDAGLAGIRRTSMGFVFQSFHLIERLTALANVEQPLLYTGMALRMRRARAAALLAGLGLDERMGHRPPQLSGGQQQRVALARALANDPDLILADEPTGSLDSATAAQVMDLLREQHRAGKTLLLVTHDPTVASQASRVVSMRDGMIVHEQART